MQYRRAGLTEKLDPDGLGSPQEMGYRPRCRMALPGRPGRPGKADLPVVHFLQAALTLVGRRHARPTTEKPAFPGVLCGTNILAFFPPDYSIPASSELS